MLVFGASCAAFIALSITRALAKRNGASIAVSHITLFRSSRCEEFNRHKQPCGEHQEDSGAAGENYV
jgi:hypothetical protein